MIEQNKFTGRFAAKDEVIIRPRVIGNLQEIDFTNGSVFREGELLFTIDPTEFEASVRQAQAASWVCS